MANVGFYHLTRDSAETALPRLLDRTLSSGARAVVRCGDAERVKLFDQALWSVPEPLFLPHGSAADPVTAGQAALQPVWLTDRDDDNPNAAGFLFLLDGADPETLDPYERIFDLFDGNSPDAVAAARLRWTRRKAAGHELSYFSQGPTGWTRK